MTIEQISSLITSDWYGSQGGWDLSVEDLRSLGINVSSPSEAKDISLSIKKMVFQNMYNLIIKEIYK